MKKFFVILFFATISLYGQACPGGFYPDGTCIGPCQNCLNTGNCTAAFAGWQCDPNATCSIPQYQLCYPTYNTYDVKYGGQFCGLIIDWQDGECIPGAPWLPFNQLAPPRNRPNAALAFSIWMREPTAFKMRQVLIKNVQIKNRFWWKRVKV